jgi:hypothetical protein
MSDEAGKPRPSGRGAVTTYLLVDDANIIINIIDWDGVKDYTPPVGKLVPFAGSAGIGWAWDGTAAIDSNVVISKSTPISITTPSPSILSQFATELGVDPTQLSTALKSIIKP